jgi:hypothetical protein
MDLLRALPNPAALWQRLTRRSSSNFKFAFLFLGPEQRDGLQQVYEFCRVVDDIVDERAPGPEGDAAARKGLAEWSAEVARIYEDPYLVEDPPRTELGRGLVRTHAVFHYPREAFDEIIAGVAMDLEQSFYDDMASLRLYCYRVASCVGFLCIAIFGDQSPAARRYAEHLGLALQYTNILRDVAEDAARGRCYLPQGAPRPPQPHDRRHPRVPLRRPLRRRRRRLRRRRRARVPARLADPPRAQAPPPPPRGDHGPHLLPDPPRDPRPQLQRLHPPRLAAPPRQAPVAALAIARASLSVL